MKLTIKNFDALNGIEVRGWRLNETDELEFSYIFWFSRHTIMKPIALSRNGNLMPHKGKDRWTYKFDGWGRITSDYFADKENARKTFESMLD